LASKNYNTVVCIIIQMMHTSNIYYVIKHILWNIIRKQDIDDNNTLLFTSICELVAVANKMQIMV